MDGAVMEPPLEAVPPKVAAVTMAVTLGARTVREVAAVTATFDVGRTLDAIREAAQMGLIHYQRGQRGTIRPALGIAAATKYRKRR